jgi:hypothetical protein
MSRGSYVIIQCGYRDIAAYRSKGDEWINSLTALLKAASDGGIHLSISTVFPRPNAHQYWYSAAISLNSRITAICKQYQTELIAPWSSFWGLNHLFARNGIHLFPTGAHTLSTLWLAALSRMTLKHCQTSCLSTHSSISSTNSNNQSAQSLTGNA